MNPRWAIWERVTGETEGWRFIVWISSRWAEFRRERGIAPNASLMPEDHAAFNAWLRERYP